jgi:hypothetical protein
VATTALIFRFFAFSFRLAASGLYLLAACGLKLAAFAFSFRLAAYQLTATLRRLYSIFTFSNFQIFTFAFSHFPPFFDTDQRPGRGFFANPSQVLRKFAKKPKRNPEAF